MEINAAAMWFMTTFMQFDMNIASLVHKLYEFAAWLFTPLAEAFAFIGDPIPVVALGVALILFRKTRKYGVAMFLSFAIGALITNCCIKLLVARPRPFADQTANLLSSLLGADKKNFYKDMWLSVGQSMESDNSFPSGHTCAAMASAVAIFMVGNKKVSWLACLYPIFMAISRIYLIVHYATDVFAGAVVGLIAALIAMLLVYPRIPSGFFEINFFRKSGKGEKAASGGKHLAK